MSQKPLIVSTLAPPRSILLLASFAGCGMLLAFLFLVLIGCGSVQITSRARSPTRQERGCFAPANAILRPAPIAVPSKNFIAAGADDAAQGSSPPANLSGNQLTLGQNDGRPSISEAGCSASGDDHVGADPVHGSAGRPTRAPTLQIHMVNSPNDAAPFGPRRRPRHALAHRCRPGRLGTGPMGSGRRGVEQRADGEPGEPPAGHRQRHDSTRPTARWRSSSQGRADARPERSSRTVRSRPTSPSSTCRKKAAQEFMTCADPADAADPAKAAAVCQGAVQSNVSDLAKQPVAWPTPARAR